MVRSTPGGKKTSKSFVTSFFSQHRPILSHKRTRKTYVQDILVEPGPCHLPIEDGTLTNEVFLKKYAYKQPFVLRDGANNDVSSIQGFIFHVQLVTS